MCLDYVPLSLFIYFKAMELKQMGINDENDIYNAMTVYIYLIEGNFIDDYAKDGREKLFTKMHCILVTISLTIF